MLMQNSVNILYMRVFGEEFLLHPFCSVVRLPIETSFRQANFKLDVRMPCRITSIVACNGHLAASASFVENSELGAYFAVKSSPEMSPMFQDTGGIIVIMGVSGAGKSTVGNLLADALNCAFLDADDFHPDSNKEKMKKGIPLSEEDRMPWLQLLCQALTEYINSGKYAVLACSALRKKYREILRSSDPTYVLDKHDSRVKFVLLEVPFEVLSDRLNNRLAQGEHFMPPTLLKSQLELLEIDSSEGVFQVDATQSPSAIVNIIQDTLQRRML